MNWVVEKAWREVQRRVLARANEINDKVAMRKVIDEEWEGLEFEQVPEKGWGGGVNNYVREWEKVLRAVVREKGYDTEYM